MAQRIQVTLSIRKSQKSHLFKNMHSGSLTLVGIILYFHPSCVQPGQTTIPEGVNADRWIPDKNWRCNPCTHARWRECTIGGQNGATTSTLRTCACIPHVKTKTVTLSCDHDHIGLLDTTKDWMIKECCDWETCKDEYPSDEKEENSTAIPCTVLNDLAVILDSAGGKTMEEFKLGLEYVEALARAWLENKGPGQSTRFAFVLFTTEKDEAGTSVDLNQSENQLADWVYNKIRTAPFLGFKRNIRKAISMALGHIEGLDKVNWREAARKNILTITDGIWDKPDSCNRTKIPPKCKYPNPHFEIELCKNQSVNLFAIGIGNKIPYEDVLQIAGGVSSHAIHIDRWEQLIETLAPISTMSCYGDSKRMNK